MDLPFEVFTLFLGIALFIGTIGIIMGIRKIDGAPFITIFAGILIFTQIVITSNLIFPDSPQTIQDINIQETYHVHTSNFDASIFNGGNIARVELVLANSSLVSNDFFDRLDCIQLPLKKTGSPTGFARVGVMDGSSPPNFIMQFGTIDVSILNSTGIWYSFCLPADQHHFIAPNDRIGILFTGGNSTNALVLPVDDNNPIDTGMHSQRNNGVNWQSDFSRDLTMVLYNRAMTENIIPYEYDFNQNETWAYMIVLSSLFIFIGIILQLKKT